MIKLKDLFRGCSNRIHYTTLTQIRVRVLCLLPYTDQKRKRVKIREITLWNLYNSYLIREFHAIVCRVFDVVDCSKIQTKKMFLCIPLESRNVSEGLTHSKWSASVLSFLPPDFFTCVRTIQDLPLVWIGQV